MNEFDRTLTALQRDIERETLKDMPAIGLNKIPRDELEQYLVEGSRMLQVARGRLIEADQDYRRQRVELVNRLNDDLQRLDIEHEKTIAALRSVIARLEGLR